MYTPEVKAQLDKEEKWRKRSERIAFAGILCLFIAGAFLSAAPEVQDAVLSSVQAVETTAANLAAPRRISIITGTIPDDFAKRVMANTVTVRVEGLDVSGTCTGAVYSSYEVITARHCTVTKTGGPLSSIKVITFKGQSLAVDSITPDRNRDIAYLKVPELANIPHETVTFPSRGVQTGETLIAWSPLLHSDNQSGGGVPAPFLVQVLGFGLDKNGVANAVIASGIDIQQPRLTLTSGSSGLCLLSRTETQNLVCGAIAYGDYEKDASETLLKRFGFDIPSLPATTFISVAYPLTH